MEDVQSCLENIYLLGEKYIRNNCRFIGEGVGRKVYALNDKYVIKIAKGITGLHQNRVEEYVYTNAGWEFKKYLCPVIWHKREMLIMNRAVPLSKYTKRKYIDQNTEGFDIGTIRALNNFARIFYLFREDVFSTSSWGKLEGDNRLIDYGCTTEYGDFVYDSMLGYPR